MIRYPYLKTAGGGKPIVWVGLDANGMFTPAPATLAPARTRTSLAPRVGQAVNYSEGQVISLQLLMRDGVASGPKIDIVPELDEALEVAILAEAPGPWYQYEQLTLGQDFLEHFVVLLLGEPGVAVFLYGDDGEPAG